MLSFIPSGFNRVAAAATWKLHGGRDLPQNQPGDSGLDGLGRRRWTMAACCLTTVARCWVPGGWHLIHWSWARHLCETPLLAATATSMDSGFKMFQVLNYMSCFPSISLSRQPQPEGILPLLRSS